MAQLNHVYEDFEPTTEWVHCIGYDNLLVYLPGFRKEQLKVQVTSAQKLRIFGERPVGENKWSRFGKELQISSNYDTNQISAKYEKGILYVKHPIIIKSAKRQKIGEPSAGPADIQKPRNEVAQVQQQVASHEVSPKTKIGEQTNGKIGRAANANAEVSHRTPEKEKEMKDANEKSNAAKNPGEAGMVISESERQENLGDFVHNAMDKEANGTVNGNGKVKLVHYKQVLGGLVTEMKTRKSTKLVVGGLLVLALGLYIQNAIRSHDQPQI